MQVVIFSNSNVTGKPVLKFSIILFLASSISLVSLAFMPSAAYRVYCYPPSLQLDSDINIESRWFLFTQHRKMIIKIHCFALS